MIKFLIPFLFICSTAYADDVVIYDEVTGQARELVQSISSVNAQAQYGTCTDCEIFTDDSQKVPLRDLFKAVQRKYIIRDTNEPFNFREMNQSEKNAVDQAEANQRDQNLRASAKNLYDGQGDSQLALRAFAKLVLDEINTLRAAHLLPPRTLAQLKTAIKNAIDNGDVDE